MKVIVVFTNNESLRLIKINQSIPIPKKIIINEGLSLYLLDDSVPKPDLEIISNNFSEVFIIFHENGKTKKDYVSNSLKEKLKDYKILNHIVDSRNFYDRQLRKILENVVNTDDIRTPWSINENQTINEKFLFEPFSDTDLEKKLRVLHKCLTPEGTKTVSLDGLQNEYKQTFNNFEIAVADITDPFKKEYLDALTKLREDLFKSE
jgi:hypothetical protein